MLIAIVELILGLILIAWTADRFIIGSAQLAQKLGMSAMLIGLTIVALGTSAPEIFVSIQAALDGKPELAIGNVMGSNIANIGLVLGLVALIRPLTVQSKTLKREYPILFSIMVLAWLLIRDLHLGQLDGIVLLVGLCLLIGWLIYTSYHHASTEPLEKEFSNEIKTSISVAWTTIYILIGVIGLPLSSKLIVMGAGDIATILGISDLVIGLTVVAIGTSLPEVAAALAAAFKNEHDIVIGNIIGSNMFNILAVLPFPGLIEPSVLSNSIVYRDLLIMFILTIFLFIFAFGFRGNGHVSRFEGALLLILYSGYLGYLAYAPN